MPPASAPPLVRFFEELSVRDVPDVGGKNASLGEMVQAGASMGVRVPDGFATTAAAYRTFLSSNALEGPIRRLLAKMHSGEIPLSKAGSEIRELIRTASIPEPVWAAIRGAYQTLSERSGRKDLDVAVRSSATAEDLPEASFAGQQESFLNVVGAEEVVEACQRCFASLFTDRAISYREERGFDHLAISLSAGIQKMVRSDEASAGVLFTLDPDTGFPDVTVISASWGLGESVVKGHVSPDQFVVFKPLLDRPGEILVTERTDPDWGPILKLAGGVVTDQGSRTSHAAIVSRELGIPAVVGAGDAMEVLHDGQEVTFSCAEGDRGFVYEGFLAFDTAEEDVEGLPETRTRIMMNLGNPAAAFRWWRLPTRGIGLARTEFIIGEIIKVHPMALVHPDRISEEERSRIRELTRDHPDPTEYFVDHLSRGIGKLAAVGYPDPVIVRLSDFKTNEYAGLLGGAAFEPHEENPMLGFRGACRYHSDRYREGFALECRVLRRVREEMGLANVVVMVPFCRTLKEAHRVLRVMADHGLVRGEAGLQVYVMCEVPSNVVLAEEFAECFDGFSIGSNDLTQLVLGVDRDSGAEELTAIFDERDPAVVRMIRDVIRRAHEGGASVGICGQAPSDHPGFAEMLVAAGIDSISLNPDTVPSVIRRVHQAEAGRSSAAGAEVLSEGAASAFPMNRH